MYNYNLFESSVFLVLSHVSLPFKHKMAGFVFFNGDFFKINT